MKTSYIGIGSNLGDKQANCRKALQLIAEIPDCEISGRSGWYLTMPVGVKGQDWYVNGVIRLLVNLTAPHLLERLEAIEGTMGRVRKERWEARVIDLDILLFGQEIIHESGLTIPHPRMHLRRFVLMPLFELAPDLQHPLLGMSMAELLKGVPEDGQVVLPLKEI
jgi:2-amino-4-hydroxy-6-hydroxymethyldihydropteridine diphosphokinase